MQMFWGGIIRQSIDKTHNSGPSQIAVGAKSILLVFDITVIMPGHHGKSQDLAWSRLACSPCVFSHFMHFIFFSCPPLCSTKWVGGPLWTPHMKLYWEVQMYHPYRDLIPILLRVHPEHFMRLSVSHHSAEHERRAQTEDTRRGNILDPGHSRDRYLTRDQSSSSHLTSACEYSSINLRLASNSSAAQRWNWGIFTKQNWEAGWNSSSRPDGYFLICCENTYLHSKYLSRW